MSNISVKKRAPLVERHRPKMLDQVVGQESVVSVLRGFVRSQCFPNILLSGSSGVGKTSAAFAFINEFYNSFGISDWQRYILSLNASQENGIDTIRAKITPFATSCVNSAGKKNIPKIIVLDEADAITQTAQWALGPIIDDTSHNARYIFIVNYQDKIQQDLQSRCKVLRFPPLSCGSVATLITDICKRENILLRESAAEAIGIVSQNDMRMALNILSSCVVQNSEASGLTTDFVYKSAARVQPSKTLELMESIFKQGRGRKTLAQTVEIVREHMHEHNLSLLQFICDFHELLQTLAAPHSQIDKEQNDSASEKLKILFADTQFVGKMLELLHQIETNLYSITDSARVSLQERALASLLWLEFQKLLQRKQK